MRSWASLRQLRLQMKPRRSWLRQVLASSMSSPWRSIGRHGERKEASMLCPEAAHGLLDITLVKEVQGGEGQYLYEPDPESPTGQAVPQTPTSSGSSTYRSC
ncbi:unnamed protein product [Symbiodinium sp. CCMP2592]|nr:unnamed protein product [Symbiodinium sp. CCMP2592]